MSRFVFLFTILISFIGGCFFESSITRIPKDTLTCGRISTIERGIRTYYAQQGELPNTLEDISEMPGKQHIVLNNGWNRPIFYTKKNNKIVVLTTYGPDGECGPVVQQFIREFNVDK